MNITNNALRQFYPMFHPLYRPILRSALFRKAGILPFDIFFVRKKSGARLSKFHPRHPFAAERGAPAVMGPDYTRDVFALVLFTLEDRLTFPGNEINVFACPESREASLGDLYPVVRDAGASPMRKTG